MPRKYEFTGKAKTIGARTLGQIRAVTAIESIGVSIGDVGGWIEAEANLSHEGNAWVYGDARVCGNAAVCGDARVYGDAEVCGNAWVCGDARVYGNAEVYGNAWVYGNAAVCGDARVYGRSECLWFSNVGSENGTLTAFKSKGGIGVSRGCFSGTLEQFECRVKLAHGESQSAQEYALLIEFIKLRMGYGNA